MTEPETFSLPRHGDWSSAGQLLPLLVLLPVAYAFAMPYAGVAHAFIPVATPVLAVLWLSMVGLAFVRPIEVAVMPLLLGVRPPTSYERDAVEPRWQAVAGRAGFNPADYPLYVQDSDQPNAAAAAGHLLIVTSAALQLPGEQLEAILAHELGHHIGLHTVAGLVSAWWMMPILLTIRLAEVLARTVAAVSRVFRGPLRLAGLLYALAVRLWVSFLTAVVTALHLAIVALGRQAEFHADATAARLGYGEALAAALRQLDACRPAAAASAPSLRMKLFDSHPTVAQRLDRLARSQPSSE